jgi:hypothetical protein
MAAARLGMIAKRNRGDFFATGSGTVLRRRSVHFAHLVSSL